MVDPASRPRRSGFAILREGAEDLLGAVLKSRQSSDGAIEMGYCSRKEDSHVPRASKPDSEAIVAWGIRAFRNGWLFLHSVFFLGRRPGFVVTFRALLGDSGVGGVGGRWSGAGPMGARIGVSNVAVTDRKSVV